MFNRKQRMSNAQVIALGFFVVIIIGTFFLTLPIASRNGEWTNPIDALFTAVSSTCVTGLVVVDTYTHWTVFGQLVILFMIQIGGLGFITMGVMLSLLLKKKIGLANRSLIQESVNSMCLSGVVRLVRHILVGTLCFELIGGILLSIRFVPKMGFLRGIYNGLYHSVTAFCNAGFDLMGRYSEYSSLSGWYDDAVVNITIMLLIIVGGLGFIVWDDIYYNGLHFKKYSLHTKIVLVSTAVLVFVPAFLFSVFERNGLMKDMSLYEKIITSLFASVTARTAGFNTIDVGSMSQASKLLTDILMFIGGCPGSTAGGVKTTSVVVIIVYIWSNLRNMSGCNIGGRRIGDEDVKKASMVIGLNFILALTALLIITGVQDFNMDDLLLEVFSAIGTVGLSTGITRQLNIVSKVVIMLLMYCGRIGSMTFALTFAYKRQKPPVLLPEEHVNIG